MTDKRNLFASVAIIAVFKGWQKFSNCALLLPNAIMSMPCDLLSSTWVQTRSQRRYR